VYSVALRCGTLRYVALRYLLLEIGLNYLAASSTMCSIKDKVDHAPTRM